MFIENEAPNGLLVSELCRLAVDDLDFGQRTLVVRLGKGSKDRCLPSTSVLLGRLGAGVDVDAGMQRVLDCGQSPGCAGDAVRRSSRRGTNVLLLLLARRPCDCPGRDPVG